MFYLGKLLEEWMNAELGREKIVLVDRSAVFSQMISFSIVYICS